MKQRIKMATALVHDPAVLLLDEPFNGMDPRQRLHLMESVRRLSDQGRTVLFSSHILEEVEQIATHIEVMLAGRHAASGDFREIRRLMTDRPHRYVDPVQRRPCAGRRLDRRWFVDLRWDSTRRTGCKSRNGRLGRVRLTGFRDRPGSRRPPVRDLTDR